MKALLQGFAKEVSWTLKTIMFSGQGVKNFVSLTIMKNLHWTQRNFYLD